MTDLELARLIRDGKISAANASTEMAKLATQPTTTPTSTTITPVRTATISPTITPTTTPSTTAASTPSTTATTITYTIKSGDTLSALAKKNNTTVDALMRANPTITNANKIYAGAVLKIPTSSTTPVSTKTGTMTGTTTATATGTTTPVASTAGTTATQNPEDMANSAMEDLLAKYDELINFNKNYVPEQTEEDYMAKFTDYINSVLQGQTNTATANAEKARSGILSDADISKQELDDTYAAQLAELASQADEIRSAYSSGKRNVETQNADTVSDLAAQANKIIALYEQNKSELGTDKQAVLDELTASVDKIKNAYSTSKAGIESGKAETLPTYDKAMNQQDVLAQRQAKQLEGEFAQRGLAAGGQVTSELGQNAQTNLSEIGEITGQKQSYIQDVSNKLMGIEQEQATGLASAEREKIQIEQEYNNKINEIESNKGLSLAEIETLKAQTTRDYQNSLADLEQSQASGLANVARAGSTAAQSLSSGKMAIIKKVNSALSDLTTDEQTTLANLAEQRSQMLYEANQTYAEKSDEEKDEAFDQLLQEAGVASDSVTAIRSLIDDYNNAEMAALEYKIKEFEYNSLSETQKLEIERLKQDMKLNNISASQAAAQLKLQQDKFKFDKEQQFTATEREEYNNYISMVDSSSFVYQDADGVTQVKDNAGLRNYIIGLSLDDDVTDSLLLRYGLSIN